MMVGEDGYYTSVEGPLHEEARAAKQRVAECFRSKADVLILHKVEIEAIHRFVQDTETHVSHTNAALSRVKRDLNALRYETKCFRRSVKSRAIAPWVISIGLSIVYLTILTIWLCN